MFDLIAEGHKKSPHTDAVPLAMSWALHLMVLAAIVVAPLVSRSADLPKLPSMMAFMAKPPAPPSPPPPPAAKVAARPNEPRPAQGENQFAAPIEAPRSITPEPAAADSGSSVGGVEGGVPGGIAAGVVGGLPMEEPAPPAPPPPPPDDVARSPLRIGGAVRQPALLTRINPEYPDLARRAGVEGVVVLEATVGRDGHVEDVRILRSIPLLDGAAREAVRRWVYSPLTFNGKAERFVLTVTLAFSLNRG